SNVAAADLESMRAFVAQLPGGSARAAMVISSGAVGAATAAITVDTQSGAATDDLDTIQQPDLPAGSLIMVSSLDAARVVTLKDGSGNLALIDGVDLVLDNPADFVLFMRVSTT